MKSKRNLLLLIGLIAIFITGFGIKSAISKSDELSSEISYSSSNKEISQSSTKKEYSSDKKKKNKEIVDGKSSESSSNQVKKETLVNKNDENLSNKNTEKINEEIEKEQKNDSSSRLEQTTPEPSQQPEKKENRPTEPPTTESKKPVASPSKEIEEESNQTTPTQVVIPEEALEEIHEEAPEEETPEEIIPVATVIVSVTSDPSVKGTILSDIAVEYKEGDTALDVSMRIWKQKGIQHGVTGSGSSAYVQGIGNLYEFDEGPMSGWNIRVNGVMIDRSSGAYEVGPGDSINWNYTKNYLEG